MKNLKFDRFFLGLLLIVLLGIFLRLPGIFWGYHLFGGPTKVALHIDEMYGVNLVNRLFRGQIDIKEGYPLGQVMQTAAVAWPLRKFLHFPFIAIFYLGRFNSLFYGAATIFFLGWAVRKITGDQLAGLLAAFFLATADLHITYSHIYIPDVPAVFWFYLALYLGYLFVSSGNYDRLMQAAGAAGVAASFKFNLTALIIMFLAAIFSRRKWWGIFLVVLAAAGGFYLATGFSFTWAQALGTKEYITSYTSETGSRNLLVNFLLIPLNVLVAVGLPAFCLFLAGLFLLAIKYLTGGKDIKSILKFPGFLVFGGAGLIFLATIFVFRILPARFVLPLLPLVLGLAGWAFTAVPFLKDNRKWILPLVFIYQLLYTVPAQANFVFETRAAAGRWLRQNVPPAETLAVSSQAYVPKEYKTTYAMDRKILVLAEQGYERYLSSDGLNYKISGRLPELSEITRPNAGYGKDPLILQKILTGRTSYQPVAIFETFTLTPEWALWKRLGYHPSLLGKILIFEKKNLINQGQ